MEDNDSDGAVDPDTTEPDAPDTNDVVNGTSADDVLTATGTQTVNAGDGNDILTSAPASDGATLNGEAGHDTIDLQGIRATARGGADDDTITSFVPPNALVEGGEGDDQITFQPLGPQHEAPVADNSSVDGGAGNDTIEAFGIGDVVIAGGEGDDVLSVQGTLESVSGGAGNDTITGDSADYGGGTPLDGGAGDDLIVLTNSPAYQIGATADGGSGDDTIRTGTILTGNADFNFLTGGEGADRFELVFFDDAPNAGFSSGGTPVSVGDRDAGIVTTITDFDRSQDILIIEEGVDGLASGNANVITGFNLVEAEDGSFTDVIFSATTVGNPDVLTGTIRLENVIGLIADDIALISNTAGRGDLV